MGQGWYSAWGMAAAQSRSRTRTHSATVSGSYDFRPQHPALRVEVADGEEAVLVQPPVVAVDREGDVFRQSVPRKPSDVLAGLQVEVVNEYSQPTY